MKISNHLTSKSSSDFAACGNGVGFLHPVDDIHKVDCKACKRTVRYKMWFGKKVEKKLAGKVNVSHNGISN